MIEPRLVVSLSEWRLQFRIGFGCGFMLSLLAFGAAWFIGAHP